MNDLDQVLQPGTLLIIETGEFSDRSWSGPVRMLKAVTKRELADAYRAQWKLDKDAPWRTEPSPYDFLPWLVAAGYAEDVENVTDWHVGSYGRFEP